MNPRQPAYVAKLFEQHAVLTTRLDAIVDDIKDGRMAYDRMDAKLDAMREDLAGLRDVPKRLTDAEDGVTDWRRAKQRGIGMWLVALLGGSAFGGAVLRKLGWG